MDRLVQTKSIPITDRKQLHIASLIPITVASIQKRMGYPETVTFGKHRRLVKDVEEQLDGRENGIQVR